MGVDTPACQDVRQVGGLHFITMGFTTLLRRQGAGRFLPRLIIPLLVSTSRGGPRIAEPPQHLWSRGPPVTRGKKIHGAERRCRDEGTIRACTDRWSRGHEGSGWARPGWPAVGFRKRVRRCHLVRLGHPGVDRRGLAAGVAELLLDDLQVGATGPVDVKRVAVPTRVCGVSGIQPHGRHEAFDEASDSVAGEGPWRDGRRRMRFLAKNVAGEMPFEDVDLGVSQSGSGPRYSTRLLSSPRASPAPSGQSPGAPCSLFLDPGLFEGRPPPRRLHLAVDVESWVAPRPPARCSLLPTCRCESPGTFPGSD